jgi:hypothetical protein
MSTGNIDMRTLVDALAIALKPLQELQEQQLALQSLTTLYSEEDIQRHKVRFQTLRLKINNLQNEIHDIDLRMKGDHVVYKSSDYTWDTDRTIITQKNKALKETIISLSGFERDNPLMIQALKIGKQY